MPSDDPNVFRMIDVFRLFGYATQDTSEHIVELLKIDSMPTSQKITIANRDAVLVTDPYDENSKTIYVLVDDALFVIKIYGINVEKFYNSLMFTKPQVLSDYSVVKIDEEKKRFINVKSGYQIDIPSNFGFGVGDNVGVYFMLPFNGPGPGISVYSSTTTDNSIIKNILDPNNGTFEKNIKIDCVSAVIKHSGNINSNGEEFPDNKYAYFSHGGYDYIINTTYVDHEKVWGSFKFLK